MAKLLFLFLNLFLLSMCSSAPVVSSLPEDSAQTISFSGKLENLPPILTRENFTFEVRFYNCPDTNFGKWNSDAGIYPKKKNDCRNSYYKKEYEIKGKDFSFTSPSTEKWTHGFVYLKGIEEVRGKYSVGENPYWFSPEDVKLGKIVNNFKFTSTENPIPDKEQMELASKFAPIIVLKKDKEFIPTNLAKFAKSFKVEEYKGKKKDSENYELPHALQDKYLVLDESLYGKGDTHLYFHVRYADTFVSGTGPKALPGWRDNYNYIYNKGNGDKVISYYLWYDYNYGPSGMGNRHEGDLESFAILVDAKGEPKRFMVTGHNHVMLDTAWTNINSLDNHPVIYIAHGKGNADGGNPTGPYGGVEASLEAGNFLFNLMANPKDVFPEIGENSQLIIPKGLKEEGLKNLRIGPGEWKSAKDTKYLDVSKYVTRKIEKLVKWEEPAWVNEKADKDPDKTHFVDSEEAFYMNFNGRLGKNPRSSLNIFRFAQYGRSPVNVPFKMNEEQHFTLEKPKEDRCETARIGDYCPKFKGDSKTPQFSK